MTAQATTSMLTATLTTLTTLAGCILQPYDTDTISCVPGGVACPDGFACLDPKKTGKTTCVGIRCGDGQVDVQKKEGCDDANDNDLDLCVGCKEKGYVAAIKRAVGFGPGDARPESTPLGRPSVIASDANGNLFIGSIGTNVITRLELTADEPKITTFAGNGSVVSIASSEATPPNEVATLFASALAIDGLGTLFIADVQDSVIRRVDPVTGDALTVVGNGIRRGGDDDDVLGSQSSIGLPIAIAVDGDGTLFFIERASGDQTLTLGTRIRRLDRRSGRVTTLASTIAGASQVTLPVPPVDIAFDDAGTLYAFTPLIERVTNRELSSLLGLTVLSLTDGGRVVQDLSTIEVLAKRERIVLNGDGSIAGRELIDNGSCPIASRSQEHFAVSGDGRRVYYASQQSFIELKLPAPGTSDAPACASLGEAPLAFGVDSPVTITPTDVAIVGDDVVFSDPGNGVVWRVQPSIDAQAPQVVAGLQRDRGDANGFTALAEELVLEFAKQTDGHLVASLTDACTQGPTALNSFDFFAALPELHRVVLSDCDNVISVVAGTGIAGFSGDGGPAINAQLSRPAAATRGPDNHIYIADRDNNRIRRVRAGSAAVGEGEAIPVIETFIGVGSIAPGAAAGLTVTRPSGLAVDEDGGLLIADSGNHRIVRVDVVTGAFTTVMGTGVAGYNGDAQPAEQTQLNEPASLVFLPFSLLQGQLPIALPGGLLLVAERGGHRIRATIVPPITGLPSVFSLAGDGEAGDLDDAVDGTNAQFFHPRGLMLAAPSADLQTLGFFVVDAVDRVRSMTLAVELGVAGFTLQTTVSTATIRDDEQSGLPSRDDGGRDSALFRSPQALTFIDNDHVVVVDGLSGRLRLVTVSTGSIRTVSGMPDGLVVDDADVDAFVAEPLGAPAGVALDVGVDPPVLYVSEASRGRLRRFTLEDPGDPARWTTSTVTIDEPLSRPAGLTIDVAGRRLYVADQGAHAVYGIDLDSLGGDGSVGLATVVAGIPLRRGAAGDDGPATRALLNEPEGLAFLTGTVPGSGEVGRFLLVADTGNHRVRRVHLAEDDDRAVITAVLGDGDPASGGEGGPASAFPVQGPRGLAVDDAGNLFVTSTNAIRMVQAGDGELPDGADDVATIYGRPPRLDFPASVTRCLSDVALAPSASGTPPTAWVLDSCLGLLLPLERP